MPPKDTAVPPASPARITAAFGKLARSADLLNKASDELTQVIAPLDEALQRLNLGTTVWHPFSSVTDEDGFTTTSYVGYAKIKGRWGVSISQAIDMDDDGEWLFHEAPRYLRLLAVDHIPKMLEVLAERADQTANEVKEKVETARSIVRSATSEVPS